MGRMTIKAIVFLAAACCLSPVMLSCSGGGDGGGGRTPATVDAASSGRLVSMTSAAVQLADLNDYLVVAPGDTSPSRSGAAASRVLTMAKDALVGDHLRFETNGSVIITLPCNEGGQYTMDATWVGPNKPTDCSQIEDLDSTLTLSDCRNNGVYGNGTVSFQAAGVFCNPNSIFMQFKNVSLEDTSCDLIFDTTDFSLNYTNIQNPGSFPQQMTTTLSGVILMERGDGAAVLDMEFANYAMQVTRTSSTTASLTINGALRGTCLDGWITIETLSPVLVERDSECPLGGSLRVVGDGEAVIAFNQDGGVVIIVDGVETRYDSCKDLPGSCI